MYTLCLPGGATERDAALTQGTFRWLAGWANLIALVCAVGGADPAFAQTGKLGPDILQAPLLSPDQKTQVASFVSANSRNLSGKAEAIKKDRTALLEPLLGTQAATPFRLEYSARLDPILTPLAEHENELIAVNALVIAAELATQRMVDILKASSASTKPSVRYQSAYGLRRTFEALQNMPSPTIQPGQIELAIDFIGTRLNAENDPLVIDGLVRAALEGAKLPNQRSRALAVIGRECAALSKALPPATVPDAMLDAMLRAGAGVRDLVSDSETGQIDSPTLEQAAKLGGQLVALAVRAAESRAITEKGRRELFAQIAGVGESVVLLAATRKDGKDRQSKRFGEDFRTSEARFLVNAKDLLGAGGPLAGDPFKLPPGEFPLK